MRQNEIRTIGVLGGMGPAATVDFLSKIIAATPASTDQDHIPVITYSVPQIPNRTTAILSNSDAPFIPMLNGLRVLRDAGAKVLAIPCNTAHYWHSALGHSIEVPILHIADVAITEAIGTGANHVGIMATRGTIASGMYQCRLERAGLTPIIPDAFEQEQIDGLIAEVKAGKIDREKAISLTSSLKLSAADLIILACTELPLVLNQSDFSIIDTTEALARACVKESGYGNMSIGTSD